MVDWVDSWADGLELLPAVDAFVLGGGMWPDYERFWTTILDDPEAAAAMLGRDPYPREVAYARVAAATPHLVLSQTLMETTLADRSARPRPRRDPRRDGRAGPARLCRRRPRLGRQPHRCAPARRAAADRAPARRATVGRRSSLGDSRSSSWRPRPWQPAASTSRTVSAVTDRNRAVIEEFRANGGTVGGELRSTPLLLLGTTGAKSGRPRTTPLAYRRVGGRLYVIASSGGRPTHPGWYFNLRAHPACHRRGRRRALRRHRDRARRRGARPRVRGHRRAVAGRGAGTRRRPGARSP